ALTEGKFSKDEIDKISFLLRELRHEQVMLEEKVNMLTKESEILKMEVAPNQKGAPSAGKPTDSTQNSLVERIKISQEDEAAFEQKRDELRSLIRKMWEENKSGSLS
ncbi:MAG: hypothetical protein NT051_04275, partial [Candidatus Micrarchaeota archaeon]|nr:hypothetical protein [Candidatus Micrarchaeota archaeon]